MRWRAGLGATTFTPSGTRRTTRASQGDCEEIVAELHAGFVMDACGGGEELKWRHASGERRQRVWAALRQYALPATADVPAIRHLLDRLLARTVARTFGSTRFRSDDAWLSPAALVRVSHGALDAGGRLGVEDLARIAGLSASAFSRAFRGSTGFTPGDWLINQRVLVARRLLAETDLSVAEVAENAGMASAAHLTQLFRSRLHTTPGILRGRLHAGRD